MALSSTAGLPALMISRVPAEVAGSSPTVRWLIIGALALVAIYLLVSAVRCALRLLGLAVLAAVAFLAWRWFT